MHRARTTLTRTSSSSKAHLDTPNPPARSHSPDKGRGPGQHYKSLLLGATSLVELALPDRSVYRAIAKVASTDPEMVDLGLEWLEKSAAYREADLLEVSSPKYLAPLGSLLVSKRSGGPKRERAMRALAALSRCHPNRAHLMSANFLPHIEAFVRQGHTQNLPLVRSSIPSLPLVRHGHTQSLPLVGSSTPSLPFVPKEHTQNLPWPRTAPLLLFLSVSLGLGEASPLSGLDWTARLSLTQSSGEAQSSPLPPCAGQSWWAH